MTFQKYRNQPTVYTTTLAGQRRFDSKKEAKMAQELDLRMKAGEIKSWTRQVPFYLPDGNKHVVDFMVINNDNTVQFIETKGRDLQAGKVKRAFTQTQYKIDIEVV
jgi:hypothetical protein